MLDIQSMLYKNIATRIMEKKGNSEKTLAELVDDTQMDTPTLSRITRGIVSEKRNPYLLTMNNIDDITNIFDISKFELIWGDVGEQEEFVKIVILAILMNSNKLNPFESKKTFDEWVTDERNAGPVHPPSPMEDDETIYKYFINKDRAEKYDLLDNNFDKDHEKSSIRLLKLLLQFDYRYTHNFVEHIAGNAAYGVIMNGMLVNYDEDKKRHVDIMLDKLSQNKGEFNSEILNDKAQDYKLFIVVFEKFWEKYKSKYIKFFEDDIFSIANKKDEERKYINIMMELRNKDFHAILTSPEFNLLTVDLLDASEYADVDTIIIRTHLMQRLQQEALKSQYYEDKQKGNELDIPKIEKFSKLILSNYHFLSALYEPEDYPLNN